MTDTITLPRELVKHLKWVLEECLLHGDLVERDSIEALRNHLAAPRLEVTVDPRLTAEEAAAISAAIDAEQPKPKPEPVAAQHRFRFPRYSTLWARKIGSPDWGPWHACKVSNRPAWEVDSQGWEVEYRPLYTAPPDAKALRQDAERYEWAVENAVIETDRFRHDGNDPCSTKHVLDAAIDAAMEKKR